MSTGIFDNEHSDEERESTFATTQLTGGEAALPTPSALPAPSPQAAESTRADFLPGTVDFNADNPASNTPAFVPLDPMKPAHLAIPTKRSWRWLKISLVALFASLLALYIAFAVVFMERFGFNSVINGVDVSFMTASEVESAIAARAQDYALSISGRDGQLASIRGEQIDLRYVSDGQVEKLLQGQDVLLWPARLLFLSENFTRANVELNDAQLDTVVAALPLLDSAQMRPPVDAYLSFADGAYFIQPADLGTTLDADKTHSLIREALLGCLSSLDLDAAGAYVPPQIMTDNAALVQDMESFNKYVPFSITYVLGDERLVLDGHTTINWVDTSAEAAGKLNYDQVAAWVAKFAANHATVGATRSFMNGYGEEKTVSGGNYGWEVDQDAEIDAIYPAVESHSGEEREPYLLKSAASLGVPDWGSTYVEVDMSEQHMWYFVDGKSVLESDVITGLPARGDNTPEGVYSIIDKKSPTVLRGPRLPDGEYEWESPVTFWMAVTVQGVGLHDATWQSAFGGSLYLTRGSHGCINLPFSVAQELYAQTKMGTPVILHY